MRFTRKHRLPVSKEGAMGIACCSDTRSWLGRKPHSPQYEAGTRTDPASKYEQPCELANMKLQATAATLR